MNSSLATLTETGKKDSQIISGIKMIVSNISKDMITKERENQRRYTATMMKLDQLISGTTLSCKTKKVKVELSKNLKGPPKERRIQVLRR